jgi:hypothetical protein
MRAIGITVEREAPRLTYSMLCGGPKVWHIVFQVDNVLSLPSQRPMILQLPSYRHVGVRQWSDVLLTTLLATDAPSCPSPVLCKSARFRSFLDLVIGFSNQDFHQRVTHKGRPLCPPSVIQAGPCPHPLYSTRLLRSGA